MRKAALVLGAVALTALTGCSSAVTGTTNAAIPATSGSTSSAAPAAQPSKAAAPTVDWYAKTYGTYPEFSQSGTGASVVTLPAGVSAGILTSTYSGSDNFSISALDASNQPTTDLLVNTIGSYSGTDAFGIETLGGKDAKLQVTATGPWTIKIDPIDSAPALPQSGSHDGVYKYDGGAATWAITNTGSSNFQVTQSTGSGMPGATVNEIGNYSGSVPAVAGPSVVVVVSDGVWAIKH